MRIEGGVETRGYAVETEFWIAVDQFEVGRVLFHVMIEEAVIVVEGSGRDHVTSANCPGVIGKILDAAVKVISRAGPSRIQRERASSVADQDIIRRGHLADRIRKLAEFGDVFSLFDRAEADLAIGLH